MFIIDNTEMCYTDLKVHAAAMRRKHYLHRPVANLTAYQK